MVNARTRFLDGGWYAPLRDCLCEIVGTCPAERPVLIDAGCGEGYYTAALSGVITGKNGRTAGVDLSKAAVRRAARRCPQAEIAVASVYRLPFGERSADVLLDCFSPLAIDEFRRVLKPGGQFLYVIPGPAHLWELKEILYDSPYENAVREEEYDGFTQTDSVPLQFPLSLQSGDEIEDLFRMTPFYWRTSREDAVYLEDAAGRCRSPCLRPETEGNGTVSDPGLSEKRLKIRAVHHLMNRLYFTETGQMSAWMLPSSV